MYKHTLTIFSCFFLFSYLTTFSPAAPGWEKKPSYGFFRHGWQTTHILSASPNIQFSHLLKVFFPPGGVLTKLVFKWGGTYYHVLNLQSPPRKIFRKEKRNLCGHNKYHGTDLSKCIFFLCLSVCLSKLSRPEICHPSTL